MRFTRFIPVAAAATTLIMMGATQANASTPPTGGSYCAVGVAPVGAVSAAPTPISCFATFSESIAFATQGRVVLPAGATTVSTSQLVAAHAVSTPAAPATNPLLSIEFSASRYRDSQLTLYGTGGSGCYSGVTYGFSPLPSGWQNTIGSAQGYSNCDVSHYDKVGYAGAVYTCRPNCTDLGLLNDNAESIIERPHGTGG